MSAQYVLSLEFTGTTAWTTAMSQVQRVPQGPHNHSYQIRPPLRRHNLRVNLSRRRLFLFPKSNSGPVISERRTAVRLVSSEEMLPLLFGWVIFINHPACSSRYSH